MGFHSVPPLSRPSCSNDNFLSPLEEEFDHFCRIHVCLQVWKLWGGRNDVILNIKSRKVTILCEPITVVVGEERGKKNQFVSFPLLRSNLSHPRTRGREILLFSPPLFKVPRQTSARKVFRLVTSIHGFFFRNKWENEVSRAGFN